MRDTIYYDNNVHKITFTEIDEDTCAIEYFELMGERYVSLNKEIWDTETAMDEFGF